MRRIALLALLPLLPAGAQAQRRGAIGFARAASPAFRQSNASPAFRRGGFALNRARNAYANPYAYGYAYLPPYDYDSPYADDSSYASSAPLVYMAPPPAFFVPPPPPEAHPVVTDYKFSAATSSAPASGPQTFALVLKNGSTLDATTIIAASSGAALQFVSPDERHLRISMLDVDRDATLKLNRARNLTLHLP